MQTIISPVNETDKNEPSGILIFGLINEQKTAPGNSVVFDELAEPSRDREPVSPLHPGMDGDGRFTKVRAKTPPGQGLEKDGAAWVRSTGRAGSGAIAGRHRDTISHGSRA